jgi:Zn finger protein HypA/HybF involved in hydrogenase expression
MPVVKCVKCKQKYDTGTEAPAEGLSAKVVCPGCGQWMRIPDREAIPAPNLPKEMIKKMKAQARMILTLAGDEEPEDEPKRKPDAAEEPKETAKPATSAALVVSCPNSACKKKFKPKSDVRGKKIKGPFCKEPFVVPGGGDDKASPDGIKEGMPKPEAATAPAGEYDADPNPYGVQTVEVVPRCPNCTHEMESEHATICLNCGYNTVTRQWGKTEKIVGLTFGRHLKYLLPAIGVVIFCMICLTDALIYCLVLPYWVGTAGVTSWTDSEASRFWLMVARLGTFWSAGMYCFKKFIEKPKPEEIVLD